MKKNVLLFLGCALLAVSTQLTSCKKDEKKDEKKSIVGTWTSETAYGKMVKDGVTEFEITVPLVDQIEYTLNSDNTFTAIDRTETPFETESGTYSISGSTLYSTSTTGEKDTTEFELTSDNKMIFNDNESYTEDGKSVVETNKITFKRK